MEINRRALSGLRPIAIGDLKNYKPALEQDKRIGWQHFFPFMYCHSQATRQLFIEEVDGSICIYLLLREGGVDRLCLYFLPLPMNMRAMLHAVQRARDFNSNRNTVVFWVDDEDMWRFDRIPASRIIPLDPEFMYAPRAFKTLSGAKSRDFRHNLARVCARDDIQVRPYAADDADTCLQLLSIWTELQSSKYDSIHGQAITRVCLQQAHLFDPRDLFGLVVLVGGEIRSFGFGGEIRAGLGNLFITKSDLRVHGINYFLEYHLMLAMDACELVNASSANSPGVRHAKEALCPVAMHRMFRVHLSNAAL
jgi:hypothetical protein